MNYDVTCIKPPTCIHLIFKSMTIWKAELLVTNSINFLHKVVLTYISKLISLLFMIIKIPCSWQNSSIIMASIHKYNVCKHEQMLCYVESGSQCQVYKYFSNKKIEISRIILNNSEFILYSFLISNKTLKCDIYFILYLI